MRQPLRTERCGSPAVHRNGTSLVFVDQARQHASDAIRVGKRRIAEHRGDAADPDSVLLNKQQNRKTIVRIGPWALSAGCIGVDPNFDR